MGDKFDEFVYVFSILLYICNHIPLKLIIENLSDQKKVNLLNNIALVLSTKVKRNVTIIIIIQSVITFKSFYLTTYYITDL